MIMASSLFSKKDVCNEKVYKSRLEYKLYLARENPEPVFDLSECNLNSVPSGTYSLCKVFRKECLLLQANRLTSLSGGGLLFDLQLLKVLNLNKNQFSKIPNEINYLINLEELYISSNELKSLPESVASLFKLKIFDCSYNKLELVPKCLGKLTSLTTLDLRFNPNLSSIPPEVCHLRSLNAFLVDEHLLVHFPIKLQGVQETAVIFEERQKTNHSTEIDQNTFGMQKSLELLGRKKEEKLHKLVEVERHLQEQKDIEFEKHNTQTQNKNKLLEMLRSQEEKLDHDVMKCQNQKEEERNKLIDHLLDGSMESLAIEQKVLENYQNTRRDALLAAMETEMESQKALVATLLERSDLRAQNLIIQMALLQQQLAVLTAVEIERKNVYQQEHANVLDDKRKTLSNLLVSLLHDQGHDRHEQVLNSLQHIGTEGQSCESSSNFWVQQYQRLLDEGPQQLKNSISSDLVHQFVVNGISHYLPLIVNLDIYSITKSQLDEIGIKHSSDQKVIIKAVNAYIAQKQAQFTPSAPPSIDEASAPPAPTVDTQLDCVICMERECAIVFVPCGHYCTCSSCASKVTICPLCRANLDRKIHIDIPY